MCYVRHDFALDQRQRVAMEEALITSVKQSRERYDWAPVCVLACPRYIFTECLRSYCRVDGSSLTHRRDTAAAGREAMYQQELQQAREAVRLPVVILSPFHALVVVATWLDEAWLDEA